MNLSPKEQQMYNAMYEAICKFNKEVRLEKSSNINELRRIVRALNYDNPQMFYVNLHQYQYILGDTYTKVFFEYYFEEKEAKRKIKKYKKEIKKLYVKCEEEISVKNDFYRCRWFHNFLTRNVYYDNEALI